MAPKSTRKARPKARKPREAVVPQRQKIIPLVRPKLPSQREIWGYFKPALKSGQISNFGLCYNQLTARLRELTGKHVLPVSNGTVAIQIAIQSHFPRGSRILIPDYTHIGTLQAVVAAGCVPILVPVSSRTWTMDSLFLESGLRKYDGAVVVSPFGYPVDFELYDRIARAQRKPLVYDLAGAWGMELRTRNTVCMSLHATKNFSCGEGGLVFYSGRVAHELARRRSNFDTLLNRTIASPYGGNWKPDELKCAIVLAHLDHLDRLERKAAAKRELAMFYSRALQAYVPPLWGSSPSLCVVQGLPAKLIESQSVAHGFIAKQYYPLLSTMPGLNSIAMMMPSSSVMRDCVALPSDATVEEAERVVEAVKKILPA